MKIDEERLIEEFQQRISNADFKLMKLHEMKIHQNSFEIGYHIGIKDVCEEILYLILNGEDN